MEILSFTKKEKQKIIRELIQQVNNCKRPSELKLDVTTEHKKIKNIKKPTLIIDPIAYLKMFALVEKSDVEISWHGLVKRSKDKNTYYLYDIIIFPQINTATTTDTDETEYVEWITKMMESENFEDMRMHGHSHVNMAVFSSGIDDNYQNDLIKNIKPGDYYIFLILNKKHDIKPLIFDYNKNVMFEGKEVEIIIGNDKTNITNWATKAIKENCKTKEFKYSTQAYDYPTIYDDLEDPYYNYYYGTGGKNGLK